MRWTGKITNLSKRPRKGNAEMLSDETFYREIQPEWREAVKRIARGEPDRTDLMMPLWRISNPRQEITTAEIYDAVSRETSMDVKAIKGRNRKRRFCKARWLVAYVANDLFPDRSCSELARKLNCDRTSVAYSLKRAVQYLEDDGEYLDLYQRVKLRLGYA